MHLIFSSRGGTICTTYYYHHYILIHRTIKFYPVWGLHFFHIYIQYDLSSLLWFVQIWIWVSAQSIVSMSSYRYPLFLSYSFRKNICKFIYTLFWGYIHCLLSIITRLLVWLWQPGHRFISNDTFTSPFFSLFILIQ